MSNHELQKQKFEDILFDTTRVIVETEKTDKFNCIHTTTLSDENNNIIATRKITSNFVEFSFNQ